MSDLINRIRSAQILAAEDVVIKDLHDKGLCSEPCRFCDEPAAAQADSPTRPDGQVGSTIDPSLPPAPAAGPIYAARDDHVDALRNAAPDAQTPESGKLSLQDHLREAFGKIGSTRGAWYLKEAWERLDSLERGNAGLRELFQESQRRRVEHEDTIGDLRRQLAEAKERDRERDRFAYAWKKSAEYTGQEIVKMRERAETAEAALAAFKQEYADMKLALAAERAKSADVYLRLVSVERKRDAAADLAREECAKICDEIANARDADTSYIVEECADAIRSAIADPTAVKEISNGRKDYIRLRAHLATIATGHKLLQEFDAARTARNGEERK